MNTVNSRRKSLVSCRKLELKGTFFESLIVLYFRKLGHQALTLILDVEGTWRESTGVVNKWAANKYVITLSLHLICPDYHLGALLLTKVVALGALRKQLEEAKCWILRTQLTEWCSVSEVPFISKYLSYFVVVDFARRRKLRMLH